MYAVIRKNTFDPDQLIHAEGTLAEFRRLHAAQPGYAGSIEIDAGAAQSLIVNPWETEQDAQAGMAVLGPHVRRLLKPLMTDPSQLIGAGQVTAADLPLRR